MKLFKISSIVFLTVLFMSAFTPELSAKSRTYVSFNLNVDPCPRYVQYNYVAPAPTYAVVQQPVYAERVYYPAPAPVYQQVVVQRPYVERVSVQPQFSYWRY